MNFRVRSTGWLLIWGASCGLAVQTPPEKVDIDFHAMDTAAALRALGRQADINLVVTEGVKGTVSLQLRQTDALQAIEALAQARGLMLTRHDQVWWGGTQAEWLMLEKGRQEVQIGRAHV